MTVSKRIFGVLRGVRRSVAAAVLLALGGCQGSAPAVPAGVVTMSATSAPGPSAMASTGPTRTPLPSSTRDRETGLRFVDESALPSQAEDTLRLIRAGGPFPYSPDGVVFTNRNGVLPQHSRGWYHEYTVVTPTETDRGPRRIVTGRDGMKFFTADHYSSFRRIREGA